MNIWQQQLSGDVQLVGVSGRLDQNLTPDLEAQFDALLAEGYERFIVDMSEVSYINSGGLRCLVTAWRKAKKEGGNVLLFGLQPRVEQVFSMVGFDKVFELYPTQQSAHAVWQQEVS
jgi:anti-anti-sigma factor